ncbi:MAG: helix-turn-helix domain-containing protein [Ruminococcaceae bacterium]|nr:helix-turn-helix domain-containing protein [Oscillospiraceae bacterium]
MEMQFKERLKQLRKSKKITQEQLAAVIGVERSTIGKYESTNTMPSNEILIALAKFFNVSVDYLLGNETGNSHLKYDNIFPIAKKKFPLLGEIACGQPIFASEDRESYVMAGTDINADFCLKAKGDSMTGARILDGDIIFIKQMPMVNNGEIAAVIIGDEATLKRVYYYPEKQKLVLQAENPKYEPLVYIGEELNEIRILGKAVAFQSDII